MISMPWGPKDATKTRSRRDTPKPGNGVVDVANSVLKSTGNEGRSSTRSQWRRKAGNGQEWARTGYLGPQSWNESTLGGPLRPMTVFEGRNKKIRQPHRQNGTAARRDPWFRYGILLCFYEPKRAVECKRQRVAKWESTEISGHPGTNEKPRQKNCV